MDDRNAILDPKIDRVGRGAKGTERRESSLIDFMARHDLVDRFCLDHLGRERVCPLSILDPIWTEC